MKKSGIKKLGSMQEEITGKGLKETMVSYKVEDPLVHA
jgi:hypothetical protein